MSKNILLPVAQGTEDMEAVIPADILRRAGYRVVIAGENEIVTFAKSLKILPDKLLENIDESEVFDAIVLPGGLTGVQNLLENPYLEKLLINQHKNKRMIAAICAAPTILTGLKIIDNTVMVTSHPGSADKFAPERYSTESVVVSDNIITSRGAGTAIEFSLKIVEILSGKAAAEKIAEGIVY